MKTRPAKSAAVRRSLRAMTMVEFMTTVALFTVAVAALLSLNLFGLRQDELINSKLGASDQSRLNFDLMLGEIRSGKNVQIGQGSYLNFKPTTNALQQGDTIQIIPSTNNAVYIYYYFVTNAPTNSSWLCRAYVTNAIDVNGNITATTLIATNIVAQSITNMTMTSLAGVTTNLITNAMVFSAVYYNGTNWAILTNDPCVFSSHNYLVSVLLQFYQYQYPMTKVGTNYLYDYYQIQLSAARRSVI